MKERLAISKYRRKYEHGSYNENIYLAKGSCEEKPSSEIRK